MCFGCSKEPSHRGGSFEYPQHMFCLRNKKNNFQLRTLSGGLNAECMYDWHYCFLRVKVSYCMLRDKQSSGTEVNLLKIGNITL